jgi:potassium-transporting ATPase KdpC subunit
MLGQLRQAALLLVLMTVALGLLYPLVITGIARAAFPVQSAGSLIESGGKLVGSTLIGQQFSDPKYFWGRPSATSPQSYNGLASSPSNLGPLNPALLDAVRANAKALREADPENHQPLPVDLVTASGSGLDPDISWAAAHYQAARVARARNLPLAKIEALINAHQEGRLFGFIGERRVNVLTLNLALDRANDPGVAR